MSLEKSPTTGVVLELFGPTIEYLTSPDDDSSDFCVVKGTIPRGSFVPMHTHGDTEGFLVLSGAVEGLRHEPGVINRIPARAGDYVSVDLHVHQIEGFFEFPWINTTAVPCVHTALGALRQGTVVVSPHAGRIGMATHCAHLLRAPVIVLHKQRQSAYGLLLEGARERLDEPNIRAVYVTDSIEIQSPWPTLHVVPIATLLAQALLRDLKDSTSARP
ncbi:MAG: hypothetical protein IT168_24150 [Bryobacterales bacterium]|nr:hypothetical protein [Bryobacterales bacterium]